MATAETQTPHDEHASPGGLVYDGFISYSHATDDLLAPRLQAALQRFGVDDGADAALADQRQHRRAYLRIELLVEPRRAERVHGAVRDDEDAPRRNEQGETTGQREADRRDGSHRLPSE